jgi:hypothetical protein
MKTKRKSTATHSSPQLQKLARRLAAWRRVRSRGQHMPEDLWKAAGKLADMYGISRVSAALKVNYYDLQRRTVSGWRPGHSPAKTTFVELPIPSSGVPRTDFGTLEWVEPSGSMLTLRLPQAGPTDLLPLVELFLHHRP